MYQCFCWTVLVYHPSTASLGLICLALVSHHCEHLLDKKLAILSVTSTAVHRQALGKRRPRGNAGPLEPCLHLGSHCRYQK